MVSTHEGKVSLLPSVQELCRFTNPVSLALLCPYLSEDFLVDIIAGLACTRSQRNIFAKEHHLEF